jgi:hypothetical protein
MSNKKTIALRLRIAVNHQRMPPGKFPSPHFARGLEFYFISIFYWNTFNALKLTREE